MDRITFDEKANFEEKVSTIGGIMGLLTGFSIISAVEIFYFGIKIAFQFIKKRTDKNIDIRVFKVEAILDR